MKTKIEKMFLQDVKDIFKEKTKVKRQKEYQNTKKRYIDMSNRGKLRGYILLQSLMSIHGWVSGKNPPQKDTLQYKLNTQIQKTKSEISDEIKTL